ncbi:hypothetical protein Scep_016211 [Stephania cephalantha]|uniref:Protein XRI1 n=1 Tax=Stephania cephalantha TaxID=152367 RepID=A0AAP0NT03_9MAGN
MSSYSSSSLDWNLHDLELLKAADISMAMEPTMSSFSPSDSDLSTGYLQDVLNIEWRSPCKRRKLSQQSHDDDQIMSIDYVLQNYWAWDCTSNPTVDFGIDCLGNLNNMISAQPDENLNYSSMSSVSDEENTLPETKAPEEAVSASETSNNSTNSASSCKELFKTNSNISKQSLISRNPLSTSGDRCRRRKKLGKGVVYPFAVVKPGGFEGDVTLDDINERILMPPTRPVRHPVGDFACHPWVSSPNGPGLSGKAVVAFTRIQTQGRGTITIIRTRG